MSRRLRPRTRVASALRLLAALVLLGLAAVAIMLAHDLRAWRSALNGGDVRFLQAPANATWRASTVLPAHFSEHLLGLSGQLAFRSAAQSFVGVHSLGQGLDNGFSESQQRDDLETVLSGLTGSPSALRNSEVENMLGILSFADSQQNGSNTPAPVERSVSAFQTAVELDPENEDAKFNLEVLLHELLAHGVRPGSNNSGGPATGHRGASGGSPGRGY